MTLHDLQKQFHDSCVKGRPPDAIYVPIEDWHALKKEVESVSLYGPLSFDRDFINFAFMGVPVGIAEVEHA